MTSHFLCPPPSILCQAIIQTGEAQLGWGYDLRFCRRKNEGASERLSNLPTATQPVQGPALYLNFSLV